MCGFVLFDVWFLTIPCVVRISQDIPCMVRIFALYIMCGTYFPQRYWLEQAQAAKPALWRPYKMWRTRAIGTCSQS